MSKGIVALEWMVSKLPKDGYAAEDIQTIRRVRDLLDSLVGDPPNPSVLPHRKSSRLSLGELHKLAAEAMVGPSSAADTTTADKGIAHKLHATSLADLLEAVGVNVAILAQVDKPSKILKLLGGTDMLQTMARYVFEAVRPHAQLGGEEKVEEEAAHFRQLERPSERQRAYQLAKHLDTELGQTREELAECVGQLNHQRQAEATPAESKPNSWNEGLCTPRSAAHQRHTRATPAASKQNPGAQDHAHPGAQHTSGSPAANKAKHLARRGDPHRRAQHAYQELRH